MATEIQYQVDKSYNLFGSVNTISLDIVKVFDAIKTRLHFDKKYDSLYRLMESIETKNADNFSHRYIQTCTLTIIINDKKITYTFNELIPPHIVFDLMFEIHAKIKSTIKSLKMENVKVEYPTQKLLIEEKQS